MKANNPNFWKKKKGSREHKAHELDVISPEVKKRMEEIFKREGVYEH